MTKQSMKNQKHTIKMSDVKNYSKKIHVPKRSLVKENVEMMY